MRSLIKLKKIVSDFDKEIKKIEQKKKDFKNPHYA
jgi:hypothetical protein